ncbi:hypothetical protein FLP10_12390 [Agromyces intestinalis]|uniref:Uncharacterized protein n=1 Tax=Agromyces intestinalis TaxID=2592652 RepID=A0A5C1YGL2_9MICO|nr:hypothetical protein [Agromyces intestinalis]QEO15121.1 hypothetical protein FLP10_12390 [Agromyces intestinalis]
MSDTTNGPDPERRDPESTEVADEALGTGPVDVASADVEPSEPVAVEADALADEPTIFDEPAADEASEPVEPDPVVEPEASDVIVAEPVIDEAAERAAAEAAQRAALDEAVQRASAVPLPEDALPAPVPAESLREPEPLAEPVRRETFVPADESTGVAGAAAAGAAAAGATAPGVGADVQAPQTVYVQAPAPPRNRGNRGFGVLVAAIGAVVFAALYAGVAYLLLLAQGGDAASVFVTFVSRPVYWVPIIAAFVGFALLAAIVNRGSYWTYAVFGLLVAVLVYFSYIGAALLTVQAWTLTFDQAQQFIGQRWLDPFAITAAVIAREIPVWFGGWIAARGRTITQRNREALEAYDRELAAGPKVTVG